MSSVRDSLDNYLIASVLAAQQLTAQPGSAKEPLSIATTTSNFKRFVQKSGPIFAAQDAAEAVFRWENPTLTVFFGVAWSFLCFYPVLLIVLPNVLLVSVLLHTYHPDSLESETPLPAPPVEGSVDYLANLQNIQIMMGRIADLSDLGRSLVPYLIWSNSSTSLVLLQLAVVSGVLLAIVAPLIPWRYLFLIGGLSALLAGHPMAISLVKESTPYLRKTFQRYSRIVVLFLRDDALTDLELSSEIVELEKLELERATVEGFVMESFTGGELPKGFRWLAGEDWEIDHTGAWAAGVIDELGWTYLFVDGTRAASGIASATRPTAQLRRRCWVRRAVRIVPPSETSL